MNNGNVVKITFGGKGARDCLALLYSVNTSRLRICEEWLLINDEVNLKGAFIISKFHGVSTVIYIGFIISVSREQF